MACTSRTCAKKGEAIRQTIRVFEAGEMPAISAPWLVGTEPLCERGSCGEANDIKAATALSSAKRKRWFQPVYINSSPVDILQFVHLD
jgi:hypothetical protein